MWYLWNLTLKTATLARGVGRCLEMVYGNGLNHWAWEMGKKDIQLPPKVAALYGRPTLLGNFWLTSPPRCLWCHIQEKGCGTLTLSLEYDSDRQEVVRLQWIGGGRAETKGSTGSEWCLWDEAPLSPNATNPRTRTDRKLQEGNG